MVVLVADLGREADGSEDCGEHCGEDPEPGHVRRELFTELGEVGASSAAAAATAAAAAASAASAAATAQTEPHRRCPSALGRASNYSVVGSYLSTPVTQIFGASCGATPGRGGNGRKCPIPDKAWISAHLLIIGILSPACCWLVFLCFAS